MKSQRREPDSKIAGYARLAREAADGQPKGLMDELEGLASVAKGCREESGDEDVGNAVLFGMIEDLATILALYIGMQANSRPTT